MTKQRIAMILGLTLLISCSDDGDADKPRPSLRPANAPSTSAPAVGSSPAAPNSAPSAGRAPSTLVPVAAPVSTSPAADVEFIKSIVGSWLDVCKPSDTGSRRFTQSFTTALWTTNVFDYASADCSGSPTSSVGSPRSFAFTSSAIQDSWHLLKGTCTSAENGCKDKNVALRLKGDTLETSNLKPGLTQFVMDDETRIYLYKRDPLVASPSPSPVAPTPSPSPAAPVVVTPVAVSPVSGAAAEFVASAQGTWIPQECIKDNRDSSKSLKYAVAFEGQEFKTNIYRYMNDACAGAPEIKADGEWTFSYSLTDLGNSWFAMDAVRMPASGNGKTLRLFRLEGGTLQQYRLKKEETVASLGNDLGSLKTDVLNKVN